MSSIDIKYMIDCRFNNYKQWDHEALLHFRNVVEETLNEAHAREHQIFNRAGALLSLNGIILALIVSFGIGTGFSNSVNVHLTIGTILVLISCLIIAWSIVPNYRFTISMCSGDDDYIKHSNNAEELFALITAERSAITEITMRSITKSSLWLGHGICIFFIGLSFIAISIGVTAFGESIYMYCVLFTLTIAGIIVLEQRNLSK